MSMYWLMGIELSKVTTSNNTIKFTYNADGLRTGKEDSNYKIYYYDTNNNMIAMKKSDSVMFPVRQRGQRSLNYKTYEWLDG